MAQYVIEVDLPPMMCSSNWHGQSRRAGMKRSSVVKQYRNDCCVLFTQAAKALKIPCPLPFITLHLDFYQFRVIGDRSKCISLDESNAIASFKAGQDALADAGIVASDSHKHVAQGAVRLFNTKKEHGGKRCIAVTIETKEN